MRSGAPERAISRYVLHGPAPFEAATRDLIRWVDLDLDLDLDVHDEEVRLDDETQFHEHAPSMSYPDDVIRGAWAGISQIAPLYTTGEGPFDGRLDACLVVGRARRGSGA